MLSWLAEDTYLYLENFLCHENNDILPQKNQVLGQIKYFEKRLKPKVSDITNSIMFTEKQMITKSSSIYKMCGSYGKRWC